MSDPIATDLLNPQDLSDKATLTRIMRRYYNHIEELGIPDVDRRTQLALDIGFLLGFAFRSLREETP